MEGRNPEEGGEGEEGRREGGEKEKRKKKLMLLREVLELDILSFKKIYDISFVYP